MDNDLMSLIITEDKTVDYIKRRNKEKELQSLSEAVIEKDGYKIAIYGDGDTDRGFDNDPYIKYFKGSSGRSNEKIVRISILEPRIVEHKGNNWKNFNKDDIKRLKNMLSAKPKPQYEKGLDDHKNKNNWEVILTLASQLSKSGKIYDYKETKMPDYSKLPKGDLSN